MFTSIVGKVEVTQYTIGVGDAGAVVSAGILGQFDGIQTVRAQQAVMSSIRLSIRYNNLRKLKRA